MKIASFLGRKGEEIATNYLTRKGYRILERNFSIRYGEIDIIALHQNRLIFIEVKSRMSTRYGLPIEAITPRKLASLIKTAEYFSLLHPHFPKEKRIDAVGILFDATYQVLSIDHRENITF